MKSAADIAVIFRPTAPQIVSLAANRDSLRIMNENDNENPLHFLSATTLVSSSILAALVARLAGRGVLSDEDTREIYDQALLALEQSAAAADGDDMRRVYAAARRIIEDPLHDT